jgi:DNA (cytosine-5)-methyltransferase 1
MLSIEDIAKFTNSSIKSIRREIATGELKSLKKNNKILIDESDFANWKDSKRVCNLFGEYELGLNIKHKNKSKLNFVDFVNWLDISDEMKNFDGWNNKNDRTDFNFIDLFSGAGGLSCGLVMAGFIPVGTVEILDCAVKTYKRNFIDGKGFDEVIETRDIREEIVKNDLINQVSNKHIHLISGGFPCQGFSMAGNRIACDERNSLYMEMLKIVGKIKPDFVLMENVVGLRSMLNGEIEKKIIEDYKKIGYEMNITILNSADYGVPQTRKRVIFIGNRLGLKNYHPKPFLKENEYKTVGCAIERFMNIKEDKTINHEFTKHTDEIIERLKLLEQGKSLYKNYSDAWKRVFWNAPSPTVKENHGGVNVHPLLPRVMTPRELATLQSFPDDFIFEGTKKWQLVQIGNAVPPLLGKAIGFAIKNSLKIKGDNKDE